MAAANVDAASRVGDATVELKIELGYNIWDPLLQGGGEMAGRKVVIRKWREDSEIMWDSEIQTYTMFYLKKSGRHVCNCSGWLNPSS